MKKLEIHIPYVHILDKNHCSDSLQTALKCRELFQDVLCCRDYAKRVVPSFALQI